MLACPDAAKILSPESRILFVELLPPLFSELFVLCDERFQTPWKSRAVPEIGKEDLVASEWIYVVDDNEVARSVAKAVLEDAGYRVDCFDSGFQLNAAIRDRKPDLILLDVRMPALGGEQVAQILGRYEFSKNIPILLYSEVAEDDLRDLSVLIGAGGFVRKSDTLTDLATTVAHHLRPAEAPA